MLIDPDDMLLFFKAKFTLYFWLQIIPKIVARRKFFLYMLTTDDLVIKTANYANIKLVNEGLMFCRQY